ncbi:MAG: DUF4388 domain-containing protein [Calditrichaeota bacterium]|nr:MAG: DUF4388 domain-containing protein [Calditrichota bacterium]
MRKKILIADNFEHEFTELRQSLIAAGYEVRIASNAGEIMPLVQQISPHLIIIETRLPDLDLKLFIQQIKKNANYSLIPVVLAGNPRTIEEKEKIFNFEIDEFLYKPYEPEETLVRLETLLKEAELAKEKVPVTTGGFNGSLTEMTLVDLLQTLDVGKKTGIIKLGTDNVEGFTYVTDGEVINAVLGDLEAKPALLRMFTWKTGFFAVKMQPHHTEKKIFMTTQELISEGITRQYRWKKLSNDLPSLQTIVQKVVPIIENLNKDELKLAEMIDEKKRFIDIIEKSPFDDLKALRILKKLYENDVIKGIENSFTKTNEESVVSEFIDQNVEQSPPQRVENTFTKALKHAASHMPPHFDRRKTERRRDGRVETDRRHGYRSHPGNICLNKSELIMLRNKLIAELQHK